MLTEHERAAAKASAQAAMDAASAELARGAIGEAEWQRRTSAALASSYLRDADPRWQSGFDGDPEPWRQARALVLDAFAETAQPFEWKFTRSDLATLMAKLNTASPAPLARYA